MSKVIPVSPPGDCPIEPTNNPPSNEPELASPRGRASKESSERKRKANRENATKSTGPQDTNSTKFNAVKHGLRATGLTELDDPEAYQSIVKNLQEEGLQAVKTCLIENIALEVVRLKRGARFEAEYITKILDPEVRTNPIKELFPDSASLTGTVIKEGFVPAVDVGAVQTLVTVYQRVRTSSINTLLRLTHEYERLQRIEDGEVVQAPLVGDISLTVAKPSPNVATPSDMERRGEAPPVFSVLEGQNSSGRRPNGNTSSQPQEDELRFRANDDNPPNKVSSLVHPVASRGGTGADVASVAQNSLATEFRGPVREDDLPQRQPTVDGAASPNEATALHVSDSYEDSGPLCEPGTDRRAGPVFSGSEVISEIPLESATAPLRKGSRPDLPNEANSQKKLGGPSG